MLIYRINIFVFYRVKQKGSKNKKNWIKPTINILKIRDTLSKEYDLYTEERGTVQPGAEGKFDNDGPS